MKRLSLILATVLITTGAIAQLSPTPATKQLINTGTGTGITLHASTVDGTLIGNGGSITNLNSVIYVSPDGSDTNPGTFGKPLLTLTNAAAKAVAGQTIQLKPGFYQCSNVVALATGVTLAGAGTELTTVEIDGLGNPTILVGTNNVVQDLYAFTEGGASLITLLQPTNTVVRRVRMRGGFDNVMFHYNDDITAIPTSQEATFDHVQFDGSYDTCNALNFGFGDLFFRDCTFSLDASWYAVGVPGSLTRAIVVGPYPNTHLYNCTLATTNNGDKERVIEVQGAGSDELGIGHAYTNSSMTLQGCTIQASTNGYAIYNWTDYADVGPAYSGPVVDVDVTGSTLLGRTLGGGRIRQPIAASMLISTNALSEWPSYPRKPGDCAIVSSNGYPYLLLSTNAASGSLRWTGTNRLGW